MHVQHALQLVALVHKIYTKSNYSELLQDCLATFELYVTRFTVLLLYRDDDFVGAITRNQVPEGLEDCVEPTILCSPYPYAGGYAKICFMNSSRQRRCCPFSLWSALMVSTCQPFLATTFIPFDTTGTVAEFLQACFSPF